MLLITQKCPVCNVDKLDNFKEAPNWGWRLGMATLAKSLHNGTYDDFDWPEARTGTNFCTRCPHRDCGSPNCADYHHQKQIDEAEKHKTNKTHTATCLVYHRQTCDNQVGYGGKYCGASDFCDHKQQ